MAVPACLQLNTKPFSSFLSPNPVSKHTPKVGRISCSAASPSKRYSITLLPGDGIGPEVISVAKNVLNLAASIEGIEFTYEEVPIGGAALDLTGVPLPDETLLSAKQSDAVLLGAIWGYKWNKNKKHLKPETGQLKICEVLKVFANLRPATVLPQNIMLQTIVSKSGNDYKRDIEIDRIARLAFETARKRKGRLCSVDKANVLEVLF